MSRHHWPVVILCTLFLSACDGGQSKFGAANANPDQELQTELQSLISQYSASLPTAATGLPYRNKTLAAPEGAVFSATGLPNWARIDRHTGMITGTPTATHPGHAITLTVKLRGQQAQVNALLPVLAAEHFDAQTARDYYADTFGGDARTVRNDLTGALAGEVLFMQSHSVRPAGNFNRDSGDETRSVYSPRLVALREALVLFIPDTDTPPVTVRVNLSHRGGPSTSYAMRPPAALLRGHYQGPEPVAFSTRAWSLPLPWDAVRNGLELSFVTDAGTPQARTGTLHADAIDIGPASQLVFQSIRLGMLTHADRNSGHFTLNDPVLAASDYFQTIPVSRLVMASYADMQLGRVMVRNGDIYDEVSLTTGDIYSGDMRENVAKSQVSVGINLANFGITSHHMNQGHTHLFKQITNHHAWGNYQNGRVQHGLSGGNGIGTLVASRGNEASHEWGHAYGLGHYPGANLTEDGRFQRHYSDSGWGYIAHRSRLRDNLINGWSAEVQPRTFHFMGRIGHGWDAMSGGSPNTTLSVYTHHTAYSARIIQNDIAQFPVPDTSFASGYKIWDETSGEFRNFVTPNNQVRPKPAAVGVPVATLLGGYNPDTDDAVIYPVFHGNYGNVFHLPAPDMNSSGNLCWLDVRNQNGQQRLIQVAASRHAANSVNQLHVNLPAEFRPTLATLNCRRDGETRELTRTVFDGNIPELPPVAIVGQEARFNQLAAREMAELSQVLSAQSTATVPVLNAAQLIMLNSYSHSQLSQQLSQEARPVYQRWYEQQQGALRLTRLLNKIAADNLPAADQQALLTSTLQELASAGYDVSLSLTGTGIHGPRRFAGVNTDQQVLATSNLSEERQWLMTVNGRIQPVDKPWLCLTPSSGRVTLATCDASNTSQYWQHTPERTLKNQSSNQCIDYASHNGTLIMYGCHNGWNQQWNVPAATPNLLLALLPGSTLQALHERLNPTGQ